MNKLFKKINTKFKNTVFEQLPTCKLIYFGDNDEVMVKEGDKVVLAKDHCRTIIPFKSDRHAIRYIERAYP